MNKAVFTQLFLVSSFMVISYCIKAQNISDSSTVSKHTLGVNWNTANMIHNYPTLQLGLQYTYDREWIFELGLGEVTNSEIFYVSDKYMNHKGGYRLHGEARYVYGFGNKHSGSGLYVGIGYAHLESRFQTDYVLLKRIQNDQYYQNIDKEYTTIINQYYLKVGYKIMSVGQRIFFDFGINVGMTDKSISPEIDLLGTVQTNRGFAERFDKQSRETIFLDVKLGIILFK